MFFQSAFTTFRAAVTDIRRSGKLWTGEFLIKNAGVDTFATGPAGPVGPQVTDFTDFIGLTLMGMGKFTVIKSLTKGTCFFETDMVFNFFGDGSTVFSKESGNGFKTVTAVQLRFNHNSGF